VHDEPRLYGKLGPPILAIRCGTADADHIQPPRVVPKLPTHRLADPREGVEAVSLAMASTTMPARAAVSSEARMSGKTVTPTGMGQTAMIPLTVVPAMMPTTPAAIVEIDRALDRGGVSIGVRRRAVIGSGCASRQDKTGSDQER
jgi:hypothetical protein